MKAILEIEMPKTCSECPICHFALIPSIHACKVLNKVVTEPDKTKLSECPLMAVGGKEE